MQLTIVKLNQKDNLNVINGLIHFDNPACSVTIKDGSVDNNIIKVVKYLHDFEDFSLPEKQGNNLIYPCYNNNQVDNIVRFLTLIEKMQKNSWQWYKTMLL